MTEIVATEDRVFMHRAIALGRSMLGLVWPNPAVGCVLVRDGAVVADGVTQPGGRPHAEIMALRAAGDRARGATAYVSLEPCSHWGRTPPCSRALIEAGIARAVIAARDPDPRVNGGGIAELKAAGIAVATGLCHDEAAAVNEGFFQRVATGRPLVTALAGRQPAAAADAAQDGILTVRRHADGLAFSCATARGRRGVWVDSLSRPALAAGLARLGETGLTRIAVDAASPLAERLAMSDLIDRVEQAPFADGAAPLTA